MGGNDLTSSWPAAQWWALHTVPQSPRTLGNISTPNWRPHPIALFIGLPALIAATLAAPALTSWATPTPARFLAWALSLTAAFAYVAKVTTGRAGNPLRGRHGGFRDLAAVHVIGTAVFLAAHTTPDQGNSVVFAAGLVAGTHLSYVEKLPNTWSRSLTTADWRRNRLSTVLRVTLVAVTVAGLCVFAADRWVVVAVVVLFCGLWSFSRRLRREGFFVHVHHWFVFAVLALLGAHVVPVLAVSVGAFVEGAARWSCAPLWHRRDGR